MVEMFSRRQMLEVMALGGAGLAVCLPIGCGAEESQREKMTIPPGKGELEFEWFKPVTEGKLRTTYSDGKSRVEDFSNEAASFKFFVDSSGRLVSYGGFLKPKEGERNYAKDLDFQFGRSLGSFGGEGLSPTYVKIHRRLYVVRFLGKEEDLKLFDKQRTDTSGNLRGNVSAEYAYETANFSGVKTGTSWDGDSAWTYHNDGAVQNKGNKFRKDFFVYEGGERFETGFGFTGKFGLLNVISLENPQKFAVGILDDPNKKFEIVK